MNNFKRFIYFLILLFPHITLPFLLFKRINEQLKYIDKLSKKKLPIFDLKEINSKYQNDYNNKKIIIICSGKTFSELDENDFKYLNNSLNIVHGLWDNYPFKVDILFAEFSPRKIHLLDRFIEIMDKNFETFKDTILLIDISNDENLIIHKSLMQRLNNNLRKQVRFLTSITSLNSSYFPNSILKTKYLLKFLFHRNILLHCRSSSFIGASIALFLKVESIYLVGIDGYSGYINNEKLINAKTKKNLVNKNLNRKFHSTADKNYGEPTLTEAFLALSRYIQVYPVSNNQLLSKYLKFKKIT